MVVNLENPLKEGGDQQGVVAFAGKRDKRQRVEKVGCVTFYIEKSGFGGKIIGWESSEPINHIEIPSLGFICLGISDECIDGTDIESITLPRDKEDIFLYSDYNYTRVKKIIIPKQAKCFKKSGIFRDEALGDLREIEFEDPCGWGVDKNIIDDPEKMCDYVLRSCKNSQYGLTLKKTFLNRVRYWLGL